MSRVKKAAGWIVLIAAALIIICAYQIHILTVAHSSFENYYNFRGCAELIERSDVRARCRLDSGEVITLVEVDGQWFLEGDFGY